MLISIPPRRPALVAGAAILCGLLALASCGGDSSTNPPAPKGSLRVTSEIPCATIILNGSSTGTTADATLSDLAPGNYEVSLSAPGLLFEPASRSVTVSENATAQAAFTVPGSDRAGTIEVTGVDLAGAIRLDGNVTCGDATLSLRGVAPGTHTVSLDLPGYSLDPASVMVDVTAGGVASAAFAATLMPQSSRIVLVDHFSNTSCEPCKVPEENLAVALSQLGSGQIAATGNHLNFPGVNDPFYIANPSQMLARMDDLAISVLPQFLVDGAGFGQPEVYDALVAKLQAAAAVAPLYDLAVQTAVQGDSVIVTGTVRRKAAATGGDPTLVVAVIETGIHYAAPNSLTEWDDIVRRFLPNPDGAPLTIGVNEEYAFRYAHKIGSAWSARRLEAVASVQDAVTRVVYQAAESR